MKLLKKSKNHKRLKQEILYDPKFVDMILKSSKEQNGKVLTEEYKAELFKDL
jgi:hypothetical protein